jgi:hypothetical protein
MRAGDCQRYDEAVSEGYDWLVQRALDLRGDLAAILAELPPRERQREPDWQTGYYAARVRLIGLLLPPGGDLDAYSEAHDADEEDAERVERFAELRTPGSPPEEEEERSPLGF